MKNPLIEREGAELLNLIDALGDREWQRFQSRHNSVLIDDQWQPADLSGYPPSCSFRFVKEDPQIIEQLKQAVDSYRGKVAWVMYGHNRSPLPGTNWVICTKRSREIGEEKGMGDHDVRVYMKKNEPEFSPVAYADLIGLTEHIRVLFKL